MISPRKFIVLSLMLLGSYAARSQTRDQASDTASRKAKKQNVLLHPQRFYHKFMPHFKIKRVFPDSLYIKTYPDDATASVHFLSPDIKVNFSPRRFSPSSPDPASKFRTSIADIAGFGFNYKLVTVAFSFLLKNGMNVHSDYSPSSYGTATIRYNAAAYAFQFKYLRIRGFTDVNQPDTRLPGVVFRKRPDMINKEFQFENVFNLSWKKYSYVAPLNFSQRQIISRVGFLIKAGVYYNQLSSDSALIDKGRQQYYDNFNDVKTIRSLSLRVAPGVGANIVFFKRLYFSTAVFTSVDLFLYKYLINQNDKVHGREAPVFVLDGYSSLGYQSRRFYAGIRYELQQRAGHLSSLKMNTSSSYSGIEIGYRFRAPSAVKKFYKATMPPEQVKK